MSAAKRTALRIYGYATTFPDGGTAICESERTAQSFVKSVPGTTYVPIVSGDVATDLLTALAALVERHDFKTLDKGIGTSTDAGRRWLAARAAISEAVSK